MTLGPAFYLETLYRVNQVRNIHYVVTSTFATPTPVQIQKKKIILPTILPKFSQKSKTFFGQISGGDKIEVISPVSSKYGIVIPKIGANAPIFPNVDPGDPEKYLPILKKGVAHAAGTVFPGVSGNIYLFAHSTDAFWNVGRYNAVFYLLKELEKDDEIDIFFGGIRHIYRVVEKKKVKPSEIEFLTKPTNFEQLILQTCWPPGTTLKRLLIIARPERDLNR